MYIGASPIIAPPQPALSPAAKKTRRPTINRSPAIPKIPHCKSCFRQSALSPRKKDPPPNHQPLARNPENPPKSCKSCFRQSALSPAASADQDARNPENLPKSCKSCFRQHPPQFWDAPQLSFQFDSLFCTPLLYETINVWKSFTPNSSTSSSKGCVTSRPKPQS